jgi:hypothetical protein
MLIFAAKPHWAPAFGPTFCIILHRCSVRGRSLRRIVQTPGLTSLPEVDVETRHVRSSSVACKYKTNLDFAVDRRLPTWSNGSSKEHDPVCYSVVHGEARGLLGVLLYQPKPVALGQTSRYVPSCHKIHANIAPVLPRKDDVGPQLVVRMESLRDGPVSGSSCASQAHAADVHQVDQNVGIILHDAGSVVARR